jgi:hypothetical protein
MTRKVKELKTGFELTHLTYKCVSCDGYEVFAELHPMERQRHKNDANHLKLRLRCANPQCGGWVDVHHGAVEHRSLFVAHRHPRTKS